ncbi:DNA ligase 1 isoform X2 [Monomorium pharaonis]|uniref:DNA ligase 1 isoform X2 n=1 Tax=Monomorium pharaonis TaxID=307658 RepID=UPI001747767B|nr:DNA ligase 1 isoform X2 [Monomorium pharaonis]
MSVPSERIIYETSDNWKRDLVGGSTYSISNDTMEMEVICISSDDELDLQKENKTDKSQINSIETENKVCNSPKIEILNSDNEQVEENHLKRKIEHVNKEEIICNTEKRKKMNNNQGTSKVTKKVDLYPVPEIRLVKSDYYVQPNKNQEINEKMQLIVKKKKKISYVAQDVFPLFISLCLQKCPKSDKIAMDKIISKLKTRYENLDQTYIVSENFITFLNEKREAIKNDNKKIYVHIEEVMNEMKKNIRKKSKVSQNDEIYDAVPSTSYATKNVPVNNVVKSNNNDDSDDSDNERKARQIKKLLRTMEKCEAVIKELEEEEVDFDQEEDSNYMKVETYKRRMVKLYNKLCELTGENVDAGRAYLRPKHLNVTQIVAVDQAITNFINSKIIKRNQLFKRNLKEKKERTLTDDLIFPDYNDILKCVKDTNDRVNLQLDKEMQRNIAEKAFKEIGEHLQRTRRNDYWDTFSLFLENKEDPATKDRNLAKKLADNRIEGNKRLAAVFDKYEQKEIKLGEQMDEGTISEEEEDEDEDEEEETDTTNNEDKIDHLFVTKQKTNNEDNKKSINKTVNIISIKNKPVNMVNTCHSMDKAILNKTVADTAQKKCETVEINVFMEKKNTAVAMNENKTISKKMIPCNSNIILKNVVKNVIAKTPEDSLSVTSTTNCTKDLPEVKTKEVSTVITDPAIKRTTKDVADTVISKLVTKHTPQLTTRDTAELTGDTTETVMKNTAEEVTDETEIITESVIDGAIENMPNDEQPEGEKKPLLRLRSFAKPPMTWEDNQHKTDKTAQENTPKSGKVIPVMNKGPVVKQQTVVIPASRNIISVQNITNNYLKINPRTGQIIAPVRNPNTTIIQIPNGSISNTSQQIKAQNSNAVTNTIIVRNDSLKRNVYQKVLLNPKNVIAICKKQIVQSVFKQADVMPSSTSKSK